MRALRVSLLVLGVAALVGCSKRSGPGVEASALRINTDAPLYNDAARFLAGLPGRPDGSFHALESQDSWQTYSRQFEELWGQVNKTQLQPVAALQQKELPRQKESPVVFYPFSGPDVLYGTAFFPQATHYVMAAQESVGTLRRSSEYTAETLPGDLQGWSNAMYSIFKRSFFVTGEMSRQFRGRVADGLLPTMLLLLSRSGHAIDDVHYVHLDEQGKLVIDEGTPFAPGTMPHTGVQILFHGDKDKTARTLEYFSTDLGPGFVTNPALSRYLDSLGQFDTFIKSASFLLHWRMCDPIREYLLAKSNLIVEDDTGVPFAYFKPAAWDVQLYGEYSRPDRPFHKHYQKDLAAAFGQQGRVHPLGFSLGYGYGRRPSSLIVARRKAGVGGQEPAVRNRVIFRGVERSAVLRRS